MYPFIPSLYESGVRFCYSGDTSNLKKKGCTLKKQKEDHTERQRSDERRIDRTVKIFLWSIFLAGMLAGILLAWLYVRYAP